MAVREVPTVELRAMTTRARSIFFANLLPKGNSAPMAPVRSVLTVTVRRSWQQLRNKLSSSRSRRIIRPPRRSGARRILYVSIRKNPR